MNIDTLRVNQIADLIRRGFWDELTLDQWKILLTHVFTNDIETEARRDKREIPIWIQIVEERFHPALLLGLQTTKGEVVACVTHFEHELSGSARIRFSDALSSFVEELFNQFLANNENFFEMRSRDLFEKALDMATLAEGSLRADVAIRICRSQYSFFAMRRLLSMLAGRSFRSSAPDSFWQEIEAESLKYDMLAANAMEHYLVAYDNGRRALKVLEPLAEKPEECGIEHLIEQSFKLVLSGQKHEGRRAKSVQEIVGALPPWVRQLVFENESTNETFRSVAGYLHAASRV